MCIRNVKVGLEPTTSALRAALYPLSYSPRMVNDETEYCATQILWCGNKTQRLCCQLLFHLSYASSRQRQGSNLRPTDPDEEFLCYATQIITSLSKFLPAPPRLVAVYSANTVCTRC